MATTWIGFWTWIWPTRHCGLWWLVDFNAGETQLVLFDWSNNNGSADVKVVGFVFEEKSSFKMLWLKKLQKSICRAVGPSLAASVEALAHCWMGFNCLKATTTLRRQFSFYHSVPRNSWYSFFRPWKDERLSQSWSHPVVLNMEPLDCESSALTTRPLPQQFLSSHS